MILTTILNLSIRQNLYTYLYNVNITHIRPRRACEVFPNTFSCRPQSPTYNSNVPLQGVRTGTDWEELPRTYFTGLTVP
jgi:hypothetical protein